MCRNFQNPGHGETRQKFCVPKHARPKFVSRRGTLREPIAIDLYVSPLSVCIHCALIVDYKDYCVLQQLCLLQ
jgi:hypothetical protein